MLKHNKLTILFLIFLFAVFLRLWNLYNAGRTYDEESYVKPGYLLIELAKKRDFDNRIWWEVPDEPPFAKYLYGIAAQFDVVGHGPNGEPVFNYDFTYSRLVSLVLSSLSVILVVITGWRFISPFVGICAGLIFAMLPFSLGFSHLATLESFLLFFFTAGVYLFLSLLEKYSWKKIMALGIIFGLAVSSKITNILLLPLFILMYTVWWFYQKKAKKNYVNILNNKLYAIGYICLIGFFTFFIIWPMPWFHLDHLIRYTKDLRFSTHLSIPEVFFGGLHLVPLYYYIVLFLITTPAIILVLFSIGFWEIKKSKKLIFYMIAIWFLFPFIQSYYHMRQHGVRYIIEIYAPLSLIAAFGYDVFISRFTKDIGKKFLYFIPIIIYLFIILFQMTPYYTNYFNELVGGTGNVYKYKLFQIGWWGEGTKEAVMYLEKIASPNAKVGILKQQYALVPPSKRLKVLPYTDNKKYDYVIMHYYNILREGFDDTYLRKNYVKIHCVNADGACLVAIYKKN